MSFPPYQKILSTKTILIHLHIIDAKGLQLPEAIAKDMALEEKGYGTVLMPEAWRYSAQAMSAVKAIVSQRSCPSSPIAVPIWSRVRSHSSTLFGGRFAGTIK